MDHDPAGTMAPARYPRRVAAKNAAMSGPSRFRNDIKPWFLRDSLLILISAGPFWEGVATLSQGGFGAGMRRANKNAGRAGQAKRNVGQMTDAGNALFYKHLMRISSKGQVTL